MTRINRIISLVVIGMLSSVATPVAAIDNISYSAETQASFSTGEHTPFWLVNNRQGLSSIEKNSGYVRAGVFRTMDSTNRRFRWAAGVDLAGCWNYSSSFVIQQLYFEARYRSLGLLVGSKETYGVFANPKLSSGDVLFSGNARPIPQIKIGIPDYTYIPWTNDWLAVKLDIAFGMFTDDKWQRHFAENGSKRTEHALYHSKSLMFRIGRPEKPWNVEAGLQMAAQFGGRSIVNGKVTKMPTSFKDILRVVFAQGGGSNTPKGEQTNVYGNHVGTWNLAVNYAPTPDWHLKAYYQHYFEDHSMMFFQFPWRDGLWGAEVSFPKNRFVSALVYEFIYSKFQSGSVYWDKTAQIPHQISGRDNYYNHSIYTGWQHWGMGIGNPLAISPIYNANGEIIFRTNRLIGHHLGFMGQPLSQLGYRVLLSYTRNWGTYGQPLKYVTTNYNALLELTYSPQKIKGFSTTLSLGADAGGMLGRSFGAMLTIKKSGIL
ncbi:MAG: capsule assembly Wzi family protein [Muribaculum sp.]|nr:capsule assembly Wzi family protein [Muribaculaceae bacterium]MCM1081464.1 capsule assembly Wzi family protein [Muribaculum sp.]